MKERVFWSVYIQRCWWYNGDSVMTTSSNMLPDRRLFWNKSEKNRKIWSWEAEKTIKAMKRTAHHHHSCPSRLWEGRRPAERLDGWASAGRRVPRPLAHRQRRPLAGDGETISAGAGRGGGWRAPRAMLRARGRHGSRAHGEARPFQEYQAQRRGQQFRRTRINGKEFKEESKSNDEITYPAQRKCSTPGIVRLARPSLAAVYNHLQKFKIRDRLNLPHK